MVSRIKGFTLPEVMLCLFIVTLTFPAAIHLLAHSAQLGQRGHLAYLEDAQLQEWLIEWQVNVPAGKRTGQFSDGRRWGIESNGTLHYWWVEASAVSPAEEGWYLP